MTKRQEKRPAEVQSRAERRGSGAPKKETQKRVGAPSTRNSPGNGVSTRQAAAAKATNAQRQNRASNEQRNSASIRFPRKSEPAAYAPGLVEVRFRDDTLPRVVNVNGRPQIVLKGGDRSDAFNNLNELLARFDARRAEPSLDLSDDEADSTWRMTQERGLKTPHLLSFVTFHFSESADLVKVASALSNTSPVASARPVPRAVPPVALEPRQGAGDRTPDPVSHKEIQWYLSRCKVSDAWEISTGKGVVVAAIDWGCRTTHQDLQSNIKRTYNVKNGGAVVNKGHNVYHGTAVLGHAGASRNGLGIVGVAYDSTLWAIQAQDSIYDDVDGSPWACGIDWVRRKASNAHRTVIILEVQTSTGGNYEEVESVRAAIEAAIAEGIIVCVAAGNADRSASIADDGTNIPDTGSILVAATIYDDTQNPRQINSNFGPRVTVCAPGDPQHDLCCNSRSNTAYEDDFGGTSGATPKVAGVAALMLSASPALTHEQVRKLIVDNGIAPVPNSSKPIGVFLQAAPAVEAARSQRMDS